MKDSNQLEPLAHSPDRAAQRIGISTRAIYTAIATGELRSFKIGKRRLITETELQNLVQRKMAQAVTALAPSPNLLSQRASKTSLYACPRATEPPAFTAKNCKLPLTAHPQTLQSRQATLLRPMP